MHKNILWQAFLAIVCIAVLWYTFIALYSYYSYSRLKTQSAISSITWDVEEKSEENYFLKAHYSFNFKDHSYSGSTAFTDEPYRNRWAAEQDVKGFSNKNGKVWFDPENPNHSSLQKHFPLKECISAAFLWGLLLYFLWLGFYVTRFKT